MQFLYWLEDLRMPWLDEIMLLVTQLGEETAFLALALIIFWCVDKKRGYYLMAVGFLGTIANQFVKLWARVSRPWVIDPDFTVVGNAKEAAGGYSFPSGHSQMAVGTFGCIAASSDKKWLKILCAVIMVLVPVSRMYLGVHTPADVLVGSAMALAMVWLLRKPVLSGTRKGMYILLAVMLAAAVGLLAYGAYFPFPEDLQEHNRLSCLKNAYTMIGCISGVLVVYWADGKLDFPVKAVWWAQILKTLLGLVIVVAVKSFLKAPLQALMPEYPARAVRYFLVVIVAGILWPLTFRWFARIGHKKEEAH